MEAHLLAMMVMTMAVLLLTAFICAANAAANLWHSIVTGAVLYRWVEDKHPVAHPLVPTGVIASPAMLDMDDPEAKLEADRIEDEARRHREEIEKRKGMKDYEWLHG